MKKIIALLALSFVFVGFIFSGPGCHDEMPDLLRVNYERTIEITQDNTTLHFRDGSEWYLNIEDPSTCYIRKGKTEYLYNDVRIYVDEYGFKRADLKNTVQNIPEEHFIFIESKEIWWPVDFVFNFKGESLSTSSDSLEEYFTDDTSLIKTKYSSHPSADRANGEYFLNLKASSTLKDSYHEYVPEGMLTKYNCNTKGPVWNTSSVPWVEGVDGPGIGEFIEFDIDPTWKRLIPDILVLNGYVDPLKPYLFKQNNRIKKALVETDTGARITVDFNDIVEFTVVSLPANTTHVKLTILEVYPGTKYDDTCITAIDLFYGWWEK